MRASGRDSFVVRCTLSKRRHPRLYSALAAQRPADRPELMRHYAAIGLALATNLQLLGLMGAATAPVAPITMLDVADSTRNEAPPGFVAEERPSDDFLDQLAEAVLNRA